MSQIQWTEKTWNPISGCSRKSTGCENCYAETMTKRLEAMGLEKYSGLLNAQGRFNGVVKLDEHALLEPLRRKKPTTYFVNSMSDLFHENISDEWIDKIFAVMALCPRHTFQVLTKRADRMRDYINCVESRCRIGDVMLNITCGPGIWDKTWRAWTGFLNDDDRPTHVSVWPLPHIWLGVSVENQQAADERIPHLLETPAAIRFLSCEPLLEEVDLTYVGKSHRWEYTRFDSLTGEAFAIANAGTEHEVSWDSIHPINVSPIDWVIVGGESGANARPCDVEWIRSIVEQCKMANVPVFVKQLGAFIGYREDYQGALVRIKTVDRKGGHPAEWPEDLQVREMPTLREKGGWR